MTHKLERLAAQNPERWGPVLKSHIEQWQASGKIVDAKLPLGAQLRANAALNSRVRSCEHRDCRGCGSAWCKLHQAKRTYAECHACPDLPPPPTAPVAVIIAARNNGQYLAECIKSVQAQTQRPASIIYVDDASDDGSVDIAKGLGIETIALPEWAGVCAARNAGIAATDTPWVMVLDGDDVIPPNYIEAHFDAIAATPGEAMYYSGADLFGDHTGTRLATPWDANTLRSGNHIHTSAIVRRDILNHVGGWREEAAPFWDWDLWLRIADLNERGVPVEATRLRYRQHAASVMRNRENRDHATYLMRLKHSRPAVCCVLSDRLPDLWPIWIQRVAACVAAFQAETAEIEPVGKFGSRVCPEFDLILLYTGDPRYRHSVNDMAALWPHGAASVLAERFIPPDAPRLAQAPYVSRFLASAYNRFLDLPNRLLWLVEDDVIPPVDAVQKLVHTALYHPAIEPVVAGWYRSRHGDRHIIGNVRDASGAYAPVKAVGPGANRVDLTGTGCMLLWKPGISHRFTPFWRDCAAHDFAFCAGLDRTPIVLGEVECRHHVTAETYV
jgi:hypothetical protein